MRYAQYRLSQRVPIVMAAFFLRMSCSVEYFGVTTELLEKKIRQFKEMGCTLFD